MSLLVADLQSWGQCAGCGENLWIAVSIHEQRCGCRCGLSSLHDGERIGSSWSSITVPDFQVIVDADKALS